MKTINYDIIAILFSISTQAQIKNVKTEVKTTVTTVTNNKDEKKSVKKEEAKEARKIELHDANSNVLNKEIKTTPVAVTAITRCRLMDWLTALE